MPSWQITVRCGLGISNPDLMLKVESGLPQSHKVIALLIAFIHFMKLAVGVGAKESCPTPWRRRINGDELVAKGTVRVHF